MIARSAADEMTVARRRMKHLAPWRIEPLPAVHVAARIHAAATIDRRSQGALPPSRAERPRPADGRRGVLERAEPGYGLRQVSGVRDEFGYLVPDGRFPILDP